MKKTTHAILTTAFVFLGLTTSSAQRVNFDQIVQPLDQIASSFEEFLVQLAWLNNPSNEAKYHQLAIARQEEKITRWKWTEAFGVSLGFNQGAQNTTVSPDPGAAVQTFPPVSVGASLNLTPLVTMPGTLKIKQEMIKIAQNDVNQEKLKIRSEVLQRYSKYQLAVEVQKTRVKMEQDANANYQYYSQLFKSNEVNFEDYNSAFLAYQRALEDRLKANTDVELARIQLEEIIGIRLEDAQQFISPND